MQRIEYDDDGGRAYLRYPRKLLTTKCTCGLDERRGSGFWRDAGLGVEQWVEPK